MKSTLPPIRAETEDLALHRAMPGSEEQRGMRPTGVEPATFGLKDRRSLGPRKDPLTTELRALRRELYPRSGV